MSTRLWWSSSRRVRQTSSPCMNGGSRPPGPKQPARPAAQGSASVADSWPRALVGRYLAVTFRPVAWPTMSDTHLQEEPREALESALFEIKRVIIGQDAMLERVMVALLTGGHVLLEGVPGLAKTLTIKTLASVVGGTFSRIQFTPDLVPSDLVGTRIYRPDSGTFDIELGPVFANFLLADEINRAPAKVQSALLEVMQEQQVDRFLMKILVDYPAPGDEAAVVNRSLDPVRVVEERLSVEDLVRFRAAAADVVVDREVVDYAVALADATRRPGRYGLDEVEPLLSYGASPRGPIGLVH